MCEETRFGVNSNFEDENKSTFDRGKVPIKNKIFHNLKHLFLLRDYKFWIKKCIYGFLGSQILFEHSPKVLLISILIALCYPFVTLSIEELLSNQLNSKINYYSKNGIKSMFNISLGVSDKKVVYVDNYGRERVVADHSENRKNIFYAILIFVLFFLKIIITPIVFVFSIFYLYVLVNKKYGL